MDLLIFLLPVLSFVILQICELTLPCAKLTKSYHRQDWLLNLSGLFVQGVIIPVLGFLIAEHIFCIVLPGANRCLKIGWGGAFWLNFVFVDFLYYWQHRWFHASSRLWLLHICHHSSPVVDIWATSRNNIWINFIFVYWLFNPILGYCCDQIYGFYTGAMLTASLDVFRHTKIDVSNLKNNLIYKILSSIFVMPNMHHSHHNIACKPHNFGANLIIWDKIFGSFLDVKTTIINYQASQSNSYLQQLLYPLFFYKRSNK